MDVNKPQNKITKISKNESTLQEPKEVANEFNNFFSGVGEEISNSVKPTTKKPEDLIPTSNFPNLEFGPISQGTVVNIIRLIKSKTSSDIEGISIGLLRSVDQIIGFPLAHIFNLSLQQGIFPDKLKQSKIIPIHKANRKYLCDNYRPIALLDSI